jgi:hypothetical protein
MPVAARLPVAVFVASLPLLSLPARAEFDSCKAMIDRAAKPAQALR